MACYTKGGDLEQEAVIDDSQIKANERSGHRVAPVRLLGPQTPADRGLTALGLLMQLAGVAGVSVAATAAIAGLTRGTHAGLPVFFFAVLCVVRSLFHAAAGTSLVYNSGERARRDVSRYLGVALAQSIVVILFVRDQGFVGPRGVLALGCALIAWPTVLAVAFARPRIAAVYERAQRPDPGDLGFESTALLMAFFGACGAAVAIAALVELASPHSELAVGAAGGAAALVALVALARSIIQTTAGVRGARGVGYYTAIDNVSRYYRGGAVSAAFIGAGVYVCAAAAIEPVLAALAAFGAGALAWTWPSIVRRYYHEQSFSVFIAGDDPVLVRPPDGGATTWGWLLLGAGAVGVSLALGAAAAGEAVGMGRSPWYLVVASLTQLWAGAELVGMSRRIRPVAVLCGVVTIGATLHAAWPITCDLASLVTGTGAAAARIAGAAFVAFGLLLGVGTVIVPTRVPPAGATALTRGLYCAHAGRLRR